MKRILAFLAFGLSLTSFASQSQPTLPAELKMEKPRKVRFPFYYFERAVNGNLIGRGSDQALFCIYTSHTRGYQLDALTIDLTGTTDLRDVTALKLYRTKNNDRFDPRDPGELLATAKVSKKGLVPFKINKQLKEEDALWVVADIAPKAKEGHQVSAEVSTIIADNLELEGLTTERHTQEIVLQRTLLWAPGEAGSKHYRIPGIVRLSDGTLVASIDRRKEKDGDLPADIDVEVKRSSDDGRTWSAPITVATGTKEHGYGDAAMATDGKTIYMVMVGGAGLWTYPSITKEPTQMYFTKSSDGGKTWEPLTNITKQVYLGPYAWGGFFASGNGIVTSKGRIVFVAAQRTDQSWGGAMDNILVYSDDKGKSWQISSPARHDGDESKVVELSDGSLLVSSRNRASGANARTYILTRDGGKTWMPAGTWPELTGNACNGAFARYQPIGKGRGEQSKYLLHTLPASPTRDHLRLFLSKDEGKTWPVSREICRGESVYSEVMVFPDGTIGIISEENDRPAFDIYFTRVSLDWLLSGTPSTCL